MNATREKTRLWLLLLIGVVATLLGQTHAREIFAPSPHESGIFAEQTQASTGENYDGIQYDALDSLLAANGGVGLVDDAVALTQQQASNLNRFNKKLPSGNTGTAVDTLGDGVLFTSQVPGRVPGSSAIYQKSVDAAGTTSSYLKTTFDPAGNIIHIKDKLNGGVIPHR